jgi:hypothetical protein
MSSIIKDVIILLFIFLSGIMVGKAVDGEIKFRDVVLGNSFVLGKKLFQCKDITNEKIKSRRYEDD